MYRSRGKGRLAAVTVAIVPAGAFAVPSWASAQTRIAAAHSAPKTAAARAHGGMAGSDGRAIVPSGNPQVPNGQLSQVACWSSSGVRGGRLRRVHACGGVERDRLVDSVHPQSNWRGRDQSRPWRGHVLLVGILRGRRELLRHHIHWRGLVSAQARTEPPAMSRVIPLIHED
jgi:hypothetical protein